MPAYLRPPILEAYLELRFGSALSDTAMEKCKRKIAKVFPVVRAQITLPGVHMKISEHGDVETVAQPVKCYRFETKDSENMFQLFPDVIWGGRLAPYGGWDVFFDWFKKGVTGYLSAAGKRDLRRIGCRYVNRIDIPLEDDGGVEIADWINFGVSTKANLQIDGFTTVFGTTLSNGYKATLRVQTVESVLPNTAALVLDIDIYKGVNIRLDKDQMDTLYSELMQVRDMKNDLFESLVTQRARGLFDRAVL